MDDGFFYFSGFLTLGKMVKKRMERLLFLFFE